MRLQVHLAALDQYLGEAERQGRRDQEPASRAASAGEGPVGDGGGAGGAVSRKAPAPRAGAVALIGRRCRVPTAG